MDHKEALKGLRSGSTLSSALKLMSLVDSSQEIHSFLNKSSEVTSKDECDTLGWNLSDPDWKHVVPTVMLILRKGAISHDPQPDPYNLYAEIPKLLDTSILDKNSLTGVGTFLLQRAAVRMNWMTYEASDLPNSPSEIQGPSSLIKKVWKAQGITTNRATIKAHSHVRDSEKEKMDKKLKKQTKQLSSLMAEMNLCQALVHPDNSKPKIRKYETVPKALLKLTAKAQLETNTIKELVWLKAKHIPSEIVETAVVGTVEFAGVKYQTQDKLPSGRAYLQFVEKRVLKRILSPLPNLTNLAVYEEKYTFTWSEPSTHSLGVNQVHIHLE
jgi:hypothetical protein